MSGEWPEFYPDYVPPSEAKATNGESYRLVESNPPAIDDFRSTYEEEPNRKATNEEEKVCIFGTSHFSCLNTLIEKKKLFPKLRKKMIAKGSLDSSFGKMMNSFEDKHLTVWYLKDAKPHEVFEVIEASS